MTYELKNPVKHMLALSLTREQVSLLLEEVQNAMDKAIIALFTESSLRFSELINIKARDIDWNGRTI